MKDSFILSTKYFKQIQALSIEQRGLLMTAIFCHESGEVLPEMDAVTEMAFSFIRQDLDDNRAKYEEKCRRNQENGAKGGRPSKPEETERENKNRTESEKTERFFDNRTVLKKADNDNEYDNDSDNDNDSLNSERERTRVRAIRHKHGEYKHVLLTDDEYKKLCEDFGADIADKAIKAVDEYCETSGKTYKNYNLAIRKWGIDRARGEPRPGSYMDAIYNRVSVVDSWV